jgi:ATP-binding cassette, subfamily G (WHITE), member 2, SNQ2
LHDSSVAYGFEALMVNEFHNLELTCVPPQLVPAYGSPANQGCALPGSTLGSNIVSGDAYSSVNVFLFTSLAERWDRHCLLGFFRCLFGMEMVLTPHKVGGEVNVYRKGAARENVQRALQDSAPVVTDEEAQRGQPDSELDREKSVQQDKELEGVAKSETVFTWKDIQYIIPVNGREKVLLHDVQGYVKPGRLTALMGGTAIRFLTNCH